MKSLAFDADRIGPWVCEKAGGAYVPGNPAIGLEVDGELKVGIYYDGYTGASVCMHSRCDDPTAPDRRFYATIFHYPLVQMGCKRVTGLVSTANQAARSIDEKLGWQLETTISDYFPDGDGLVYKMTKDTCRWLKLAKRYGYET
jgi:hypothetical protein